MIFTRLGYLVIIAILATAAAAILFVLWPDDTPAPPAAHSGSTPAASGGAPTPAAPATLQFSRVIDFAKLGAVAAIDISGQDVTVLFREDFDMSGLNTTSHTVRSTLAPGEDAVRMLQDAGIVVGPDGLLVTTH